MRETVRAAPLRRCQAQLGVLLVTGRWLKTLVTQTVALCMVHWHRLSYKQVGIVMSYSVHGS